MVLNRLIGTLVLWMIAVPVFCQSVIDGKIYDRRSNKPLANASVSVNKKKVGSLSDKKGYFSLSSAGLKKTDTLILSSVGYATLKIPLADAFEVKEYFLLEDSKELENVVLKSYSRYNAEGSSSEVTGYFTSWTTRMNGGEIGRIIHIRSKDFKVEKVRFKVNSQCDTCVIRLHIRALSNGLPGPDLLRDSTTIEIHKNSFDDKPLEFDFADKNLIIKNNEYVFLGLETIYCHSANNGSCSLAYIGTEPGTYLYRTRDYRDWEESVMNSLYLKIFYTY